MSNYQVEPASQPQALSKEAVKALRHEQVQGLSRRQVLRGSLAGGILLWVTELAVGSIGFIWPNLSSGFGAAIRIGTLDDVKALNSSLPIDEGFPAYYPDARSFVALIDTANQQFLPGEDATGDGTTLNVRAMYQRCPHLGCKPNPCLRNFWLECPCHGSRYDRLGIKVDGAQYGPAPRGMDRFAVTVDGAGALTIDTAKITLGPLPIALGQPGLIPPKSPTGCI
jgi:cytochrome b6-f complex iron-sulfur subunit